MDWTDVAAAVFACTTINHLGLIAAVEGAVRHRLPVLDCPKCLTFWCVLACGLWADGLPEDPSCLARLLATSILSAYIAVWLELMEGYIDTLYDRIYEQIYPTANPAGTDALDTADPVPGVSCPAG